MKIHAVLGLGSNSVLVRNVSCYCDSCLKGHICDSWKEERSTPERPDNNHPEVEVAETHSDENFQVDQFVVPVYDGTSAK